MKTRIFVTVLLVFVLTISFQVPASSATKITPIDLGTLEGGSYSYALDVNEFGQVVGFSDTADAASHAFLWEKGEMIDLGTLGGDTQAVSINNKGQIVGTSNTVTGEPHAFLWENGVMTDLGTFDGISSSATGINNRGQIIGYIILQDWSGYKNFVWEKGNVTFIDGIEQVFAINEQGQIVGQKDGHAVVWDKGVFTDIGILGAGPYSWAFDISSSGLVVGVSYLNDVDWESHAYLWNREYMIDLGAVSARGVNSKGKVVGCYPTENGCLPFVWYRNVMNNLETLGGTEGLANAISENGIIVGGSTLPENIEFHATLWLP